MVVEDASNNVVIAYSNATAFSGSGASLTGVDVVNDTSPQLGGEFGRLNGNDIVTTSKCRFRISSKRNRKGCCKRGMTIKVL